MKTARIPMIFSALALVISLTGAGAYAASQVNGTTIMNHSIGIGKLTPKAVKQLKGQHGERGLEGPDGTDGSDGIGIQGAPGVNGGFDLAKVTYVTGPETLIVPDSAYNTLTAVCPAGSKVLSGGWYANIGDDYKSSANIDGVSYSVLVATFYNTIYGSGRAYAVCAAP